MGKRVEIRNVTARYGSTVALRDISVTLEASQFVTVLGPSGCGKTTLLRVLAGFADYDGQVFIDGGCIDGVPPHKRGIGIVFQDYALFPHMTVARNIGFGLRMRGWSGEAQREAIRNALRLLRLDALEDRYPHQLSGGQQQRVALARAVAINPPLLLLDEPLAALDKNLRESMQVELRQLQRNVGITTMFVTHDQEEALALSDRVIVMDRGEVRQMGTPMEIYNQPADRFVADFIGTSNILRGQVEGRDGEWLVCRLSTGILVKAPSADPLPAGERVCLSIRPELVALAPIGSEGSGTDNRMRGTVEHVTYLGHRAKVRVRLADDLKFDVDQVSAGPRRPPLPWRVGDEVVLSWPAENAVLIAP